MKALLQKGLAFTSIPLKIQKFQVFLLSLLMILLTLEVEATHYRYGNMSWQLVPGMANTVDVTIQQAWRTSFYGSVILGGTVNTTTLIIPGQSARNISLLVTSINPVEDWFFGTFTTRITFPGPGVYTLSYSSNARISTLENFADGNFRNETVVTIGNGNNSPFSSQTPIRNLQVGQVAAQFQIPAVDPDGDPISYRLGTLAETSALSPTGFSVSPTGLASFNTMSANIGELYTAQVAVEDTAGAKTIVDFIIRIVGSSTAPQFDYAVTPPDGSVINAKPGDTIKFKVKAFDTDAGDSVDIAAVGVPGGALFTPTIPTAGGNPDSTEFFWIPTPADIGISVINFVATDETSVQTNTSVSILVSLKPVFDMPPTPTFIVTEPDDIIHYNVQASDPDPLDSVTINIVEVFDRNNNPVVVQPFIVILTLPAFGVFPTPWGNPTTGMFDWMPDATYWGANRARFTAEDGFGETTTHEVMHIVNTPPEFTSLPVLNATVGALYQYNVVVNDPDTAQGDSIDLFLTSLPGWLSLTDNGDGTGLLSGIPGPGDGGIYNAMLEAQDVFHHQNGTDIQMFSIVVSGGDSVACVDSLMVVSDDTWMESTVVTTTGALTFPWSGAPMLPGDGTYTKPVTPGQPYTYGPSIDSVDGAHVIPADHHVRFFKKEIMLPSNDSLEARIRMTVDDDMEVYINGHLLVREGDVTVSNFRNPAHDILYRADHTFINGYNGGDMYDKVNSVDLDTVFHVGMNEIVLAIRNRNVGDMGGFSFRMDMTWKGVCDSVETMDSIVSDSAWRKSIVTTNATSNSYPWPGVASLPMDVTFMLPVDVGQPYWYNSIFNVPGAEVISGTSDVTYYRREFELTDATDINARFRMYFDDNVEIYINNHLMAREEDMAGTSNFKGAYHDVLFKEDGTVDNGHMGGDPFDFVTPTNLDGIFNAGTNTVIVVLRNRGGNDKGGFSFRMDIDKAGAPVIVKKSSEASASDELATDQSMEIYPNPTSGRVLISLPATVSPVSTELMIFDISGKLMGHKTIDGEISSDIELDLSSYAPGIYLVKVISGSYMDTQRIIKQ